MPSEFEPGRARRTEWSSRCRPNSSQFDPSSQVGDLRGRQRLFGRHLNLVTAAYSLNQTTLLRLSRHNNRSIVTASAKTFSLIQPQTSVGFIRPMTLHTMLGEQRSNP